MGDDPPGGEVDDSPLEAERIFGSDVEMTTRSLLEIAGERLDIGRGLTRLEAEFDDGRLAVLWTRRKHRVTELDG